MYRRSCTLATRRPGRPSSGRKCRPVPSALIFWRMYAVYGIVRLGDRARAFRRTVMLVLVPCVGVCSEVLLLLTMRFLPSVRERSPSQCLALSGKFTWRARCVDGP